MAEAGAALVPLVALPVLDEPKWASFAFDETGHGDDLPASYLAAFRRSTETGKRNQAEKSRPVTVHTVGVDPDQRAGMDPCNNVADLKSRSGRMSYSVIRLAPAGWKKRAFCACFRRSGLLL
jgi:hypothetical protein